MLTPNTIKAFANFSFFYLSNQIATFVLDVTSEDLDSNGIQFVTSLPELQLLDIARYNAKIRCGPLQAGSALPDQQVRNSKNV